MPVSRKISHRRFAIIGAGPFGLALAGRFRSERVDYVLFGRAMSFWKEHVPRGTCLLSVPVGCSLSHNGFGISAHESSRGAPFTRPFPAEEFIQYCLWFQRNACPDLDERTVVSVARRNGEYAIGLDDGDEITADKVVVATGLKGFAFRPPEFGGLPPGFVFHTSDLHDLEGFRGKKLAVIGSGQSALECAALLSEKNADVEVLARASRVRWPPFGGHLRHPSTEAKGYLYTLVRDSLNNPDVYRRLPRFIRAWWLRRTLRTGADKELIPRLGSVRFKLGCTVTAALVEDDRVKLLLDDGTSRYVDYMVLGTGYRVDVNAMSFLAPELCREIRHHKGYPELNSAMESTAPGLYFAGASAALSLGTHMWFVKGAPWAAERISRALQPQSDSCHVPMATKHEPPASDQTYRDQAAQDS